MLLLTAAPAPAATSGALSFAKCTLSGPATAPEIEADCTTLAVPEDPDNRASRYIDLHIAVLRAFSRERAPDPVFFISGGPGQSASDGWFAMQGAFARVRRERDIVLVDQRGTGKSNPLTCAFSGDPLAVEFDMDAQLAWLRECYARLPGDTRFYTTSVAVRDLEAVRAALGYEAINLYGISYGTRVAQEYLRRYPERVRSVILDGVVPAGVPLGPGISLDAQRALDMTFERCARDPVCDRAFPQLAARFAALAEELKRRPVELTLRDPLTAENRYISFGHAQLTGIVRLLVYQTESVSLLPLYLHHAAANRDFAPLAAQALSVFRHLGDSLSYGMHNAVVCTEDVPFYGEVAVERRALEETFLGAFTVDLLQRICEIWPRGVITPDFMTPVVSDRPVLVLSGEADPVTPPANGERVLTHLSNARHIVAPGQGHGVAGRGCLPRLVADFIRRAAVDGLDTACVANMRPAPFFVRFTGPEP